MHVGVLTKLDIMDRGTDATSILRNDVVPLRLGHIGDPKLLLGRMAAARIRTWTLSWQLPCCLLGLACMPLWA